MPWPNKRGRWAELFSEINKRGVPKDLPGFWVALVEWLENLYLGPHISPIFEH